MASTEDKPKHGRKYPCRVYYYRLDDAAVEHTYVGSTEKPVHVRLSTHMACAKKGTSRFYRYMREKGPDTFTITLLWDWIANNQEEDNECEQQAIRFFADLNTYRAVPRTREDQKQYAKSEKGKKARVKYCQSVEGRKVNAKAKSKFYNKPENMQPIYCHCTQRSYKTFYYHYQHKHSKRHLAFMKENGLPEL